MDYLQTILKWDSFYYHYINKDIHDPAVFFFFEIITNLADLLLLMGVLCLPLLFIFNKRFSKQKKVLLNILIPVVIVALINIGLKVIIQRGAPTPFVLPWAEIQLLSVHYAFPSGHASRAFALATALSFYIPSKRLLLFFVAALIGFSRIYIGAHYPLDVIAGAFLGISITWIFSKTWEKRKKIFQPNEK